MDFDPSIKGYKKMKEPSMLTLVWLSIPVGLLTCIILFFSARILTDTTLSLIPQKLNIGLPYSLIIWVLIFLLFNVVMIIVHELVHALVFPASLLSDNIVFGVHSNGLFFAFYREDMTKRRMLFSMVSPFLLFTLLPLFLIIIKKIDRPLLMIGLLYHAFCSAGDLIGMYLIIKNTPKRCLIKNKGYHTYYIKFK